MRIDKFSYNLGLTLLRLGGADEWIDADTLVRKCPLTEVTIGGNVTWEDVMSCFDEYVSQMEEDGLVDILDKGSIGYARLTRRGFLFFSRGEP